MRFEEVEQHSLRDCLSIESEKRETPWALMIMMQPYVLMLNRHCSFLFECAQRMLGDMLFILSWYFNMTQFFI